MTFCKVNGLTIEVALDEMDEQYQDVQTFDRTEGLTYEGALYAVKRMWTAELPWDASTLSFANRDWIKGRGHYWNFERVDGTTVQFSKYPTDGGPGFNFNVSASSNAKYGAWAGAITSGNTSTCTVGFGSEGRYSAAFWKLTGSGYAHYCLSNDGATSRFYAGNTLVSASSFCFGSVTAASGAFSLNLQGKDETGSSTTATYDGVMMVPYAMTPDQIAARVARTTAQPPFPHVELSGTFLKDLSPVIVKGFVESEKHTLVTQNGPVPARAVRLTFVEK